MKEKRGGNNPVLLIRIFPKNHKGISIMIGYILLITAAVVMSIIIYQWMKTYIPKEPLKCPDGVSIFIEEINYDENESLLNLTLKNNGRFNIAGYFIHATNISDQELATIDLSNYTPAGEGKGGTILFSTGNSFAPNEKQKNIFNLSGIGIGQIYSVEITPVRFQEEDNKIRFVSCGDSKVKEMITYVVQITCGNGICGTGECNSCPQDCSHAECCSDGTCNNGESCGSSDTEPECNSDCGECQGVCGDGICDIGDGECNFCPDDCSHIDCCPDTICNNNETCGDTNNESECNSDCGACEGVCGDGIVKSPEQCDTGNLSGGTCESVMGAGWTGTLSCYANCTFDTTGCIEEVTCGGWQYIFEEVEYCMYAGAFGESCTTVCLTHGESAGAVNDNVDSCSICYHFYPGALDCGEKPENWLPAYKDDGKCLANKEFGNWDVDASDEAYSRFCACNN